VTARSGQISEEDTAVFTWPVQRSARDWTEVLLWQLCVCVFGWLMETTDRTGHILAAAAAISH